MRDFDVPHCAGLMMQQGDVQRHGLQKIPVMHGEMDGSWLMDLWFHYTCTLCSSEMCSLTASQMTHGMYR